MPSVRYSHLAEHDLDEIAAFTTRTWSIEQTRRYLDQLESRCESLLKMPSIGRRCEELRSGLRRMEEGSHVIFYVADSEGIYVSRILHKSEVPELHEF